MESNNLHHLQQDQPPSLEPSSLTTSSYGSLGGSSHSWNPNITLSAGNFNQDLQEANPRSRALMQKNDMIQDLGYDHHWTSDAESSLAPKFSEMLNITPSNMEDYQYHNQIHSTSIATNQMKNSNEGKDMNALNEKLLLKTLFSGDMYSTSAENYGNFGATHHGVPSRGNFSQIYPSINISNLSHSSTSTPILSSLNIMGTTQPLDLLTSPTSFPGGLSHRSHSQDHGFGSNNLSFRLDHIQQPTDRSSWNNSCNLSHFTNGEAETKRSCTLMESKTSQSQTASKKSRLESRPSCSPIKVRKEKLGDRIAALQQLVAPFGKVKYFHRHYEDRDSLTLLRQSQGLSLLLDRWIHQNDFWTIRSMPLKNGLHFRRSHHKAHNLPAEWTDTASVLMEAIGYIKFLQGQVETLSVPYMKSSHNQNNRVMQRGSAIGDANGEPKQDLRSRGLCLVPLSCMSYIAGDGGTEVWQQPNFGGAT